MSAIEQLGVVTTRSGVLVIVDTAYLSLWSHDRKTVMPDGVLSTEEATEKANSFVDLRIVGADAERVGRMLDMSWHPRYVYDQPSSHEELQDKMDELIRKTGLDARFEVMSQRISHRQRVELALQKGAGAGEVQFHGVGAVAVDGVPTSKPIPILAERSASYLDRWKRIYIECRPEKQVAWTEPVGVVTVDHARLLIADVDALGVWQHEEPLDGMADFVFWGRDAEQVASAVNAPRLESGEFGWVDAPEDFAQEKGIAVDHYRNQHGLKLAGDYRPHSHHWRVMTTTRKSSTDSATMELAGTTVCNFMTTWGDGLFEVHRDFDPSGDLVRIRVEMERLPSDSDEKQAGRTPLLM
jgi:hypothetical protein